MDNRTREEREREFLIGLAELTRKTGIVIWGCGCCSSPSIDEHDYPMLTPSGERVSLSEKHMGFQFKP